jgi:hypothetical protein
MFVRFAKGSKMNRFLAGVCFGSSVGYMFAGLVFGDWRFITLSLCLFGLLICGIILEYIIRRYYEEIK